MFLDKLELLRIYTHIHKTHKQQVLKMDVLPSGNIFHELQVVHDTGYYDGKVSPEEHWQQVGPFSILLIITRVNFFYIKRICFIIIQFKY